MLFCNVVVLDVQDRVVAGVAEMESCTELLFVAVVVDRVDGGA